jgi:hypothetical protein
MSETARSIISDALRLILVTGDEEPIENVDMERGIRTLNRMMASFEADGIDLDYTSVSDPTDTVTIDSGAYGGVIANLALKLWPYYYKTDPSQMVMANAIIGKKELYKIAVGVDEMDFPDSLPTGSGNDILASEIEGPFFIQEFDE